MAEQKHSIEVNMEIVPSIAKELEISESIAENFSIQESISVDMELLKFVPLTLSSIAITDLPATGEQNVVITTFTVQAIAGGGGIATDTSGSVTLSLQSGSGSLGGTLTKPFVSGVATFDDIFIDSIDDFVILATFGVYTDTGSITIEEAYSNEAKAVFANLTSLTDSEKDAIAKYVDAEVLNGNWAYTAEIYCHALALSANKIKGWFGKSGVNNGAASDDNGLLFSGDDYVATGFTPDIDQTDKDFGTAISYVYRNDDITKNGNILAAFDGSSVYGLSQQAATNNRLRAWINVGGTIGINYDRYFRGLSTYAVQRSGTSTMRFYANGVERASLISAANRLEQQELLIGAWNNQGTPGEFYEGVLGMSIIGNGNFDISANHTNVIQLMEDLGVFTPKTLSPAIWLDPSNKELIANSTGSLVESIDDRSGNNIDFEETVAGDQLTQVTAPDALWASNYSSRNVHNTGGVTNPSEWSMYLVINYPLGGNTQTAWSMGRSTSTNGYYWLYSTTGSTSIQLRFRWNNQSTGRSSDSSHFTITLGETLIIGLKYDGNMHFYKNGVFHSTKTSNANKPSEDIFDNIALGTLYRSTKLGSCNAYFYEYVHFNRILSESEDTALINYLKTKHGIAA